MRGGVAAAAPAKRAPAAPRAKHGWLRAVWAAVLALLLGLLFTGLTAVTITLWATDPTYTQTNPVVDLAFFALGAMAASGFASQIRGRQVAGLQQAILALVALAAAGWLGGRIEPITGPLLLLAAATPLVLFHPDRRHVLARGAGVSRAMAVLAVIAAAPATLYTVEMLDRAWAAGPSCFLGRCVQGDRYAETAALAMAAVLVAGLTSLRTAGWLLPAWSAGIAAVVLGAASLVFPAEVGALPRTWAVAAVIWGGGFVATAQAQHRTVTRFPPP